jgi:hypothetical protein
MKQISRWANAHRKKALIIVVAIKFILIVFSFYVGNSLKTSGYSFGPVDNVNEIDALTAGVLPLLVPGMYRFQPCHLL